MATIIDPSAAAEIGGGVPEHRHNMGQVVGLSEALGQKPGRTEVYTRTEIDDLLAEVEAPAAVEPTISTARINKGATTQGPIASATVVPVTLGALEYNRGTHLDTASVANSIVVLTDGVYFVSGEMWFTGGISNPRNMLVMLNGVAIREAGSVGTNVRVVAGFPVPLAANDVLSLAVYADSGDVILNGSGSKDIGLAVTRLGA